MNKKNKSRVIRVHAEICAEGTAVGKCEHDGPLGSCFDMHDPEDRYGMDSWEKAESEMQRTALSIAIKKSGINVKEIGALFAGDLLNQCIGSAYGLVDFSIPYYGLYGACSTSAEGIMLAAMTVSAGYFPTAAAVTSSHNCTAEKQYRTPIEYGGQKPPTAQWTVTGAGAFLVCDPGMSADDSQFSASITAVMPGRVKDSGITDANNMGAAMAGAAADTITDFFSGGRYSPDSMDMILTGDLGKVGSYMLLDKLRLAGCDISHLHHDCGVMIYKGLGHPDVNSGGSGCGCGAVVLGGYILPKIRRGELKRVLYLATGAMMSPASLRQGLSIPAVCHAVLIECQPK